MNRKKTAFYFILTALGLGLLVLGLALVQSGSLLTVPYLSIGFGCGVFGHGFGELINRQNAKKHPEFAKQQEILRNDERNIVLAARSKAKAFDLMLYVFGALFVAFGIMNVDIKVILLLVGAYLFVCGACIYYRSRLEKEM